VVTHAVSEKPYELAYEASLRAIENQAATVESLRSRAGTILAATALVTSFFGGRALSRAGHSQLSAVQPERGRDPLWVRLSRRIRRLFASG
jgi:hypothetical protein